MDPRFTTVSNPGKDLITRFIIWWSLQKLKITLSLNLVWVGNKHRNAGQELTYIMLVNCQNIHNSSFGLRFAPQLMTQERCSKAVSISASCCCICGCPGEWHRHPQLQQSFASRLPRHEAWVQPRKLSTWYTNHWWLRKLSEERGK